MTADEEDTVIEARRALRDGNYFDIARLLDIIERLDAERCTCGAWHEGHCAYLFPKKVPA